jgi:hypothetical protein
MNDYHAQYLAALRARHEADRDELRAALAGRRPWLLFELKRRQIAVQQETAMILKIIEAGR